MKKLTIKPTSYFKVLTSTERSQVAEMVLSAGQSTGGPKIDIKQAINGCT